MQNDRNLYVCQKYLNLYAESYCSLSKHVQGTYDKVLTIPVYDEPKDFIHKILGYLASFDATILVVIIANVPENAKQSATNATKKCIQLNPILGAPSVCYEQLNQYHYQQHAIVTLDLTTPPHRLPVDQGVGLARKIGADLALQLIVDNKISTPWIYCTDADALLPTDYFDKQQSDNGLSASISTFTHTPSTTDALIDELTQRYELRLHSYTLGLLYASSPYSFYTIGSTIAVQANAYAKVRGFPKKSAGEDFYILNKLAKVGEITTRRSSPIRLESRLSDRTPFGTGKTVADYKLNGNTEFAEIYYHPEAFSCLKDLLNAAADIINLQEPVCDPLLIPESKKIISYAKSLVKHQSLSHRVKQFNDWFDGFATMKYINLLHQTQFNYLNYDDWVNLANQVFLDTQLPQSISPAQVNDFCLKHYLSKAK